MRIPLHSVGSSASWDPDTVCDRDHNVAYEKHERLLIHLRSHPLGCWPDRRVLKADHHKRRRELSSAFDEFEG